MFPFSSRISYGIPAALAVLVMAPAWCWSQAIAEKKPDALERLRQPSEDADPETLVQEISGMENLGEALLLLNGWDSFYGKIAKTIPGAGHGDKASGRVDSESVFRRGCCQKSSPGNVPRDNG